MAEADANTGARAFDLNVATTRSTRPALVDLELIATFGLVTAGATTNDCTRCWIGSSPNVGR